MSVRNGAVAGAFAAALAILAMLLLRLLADVPSLPELLQEWITGWLPVAALGAYLDAYEGTAKPLAFALLFGACLAVGVATGVLLGARWGRRRPSLGGLVVQGVLTGVALLLLALVVLQPTGSLLGIAAPFLLYGLLVPLCFRWLNPLAGAPAAPPIPPPPPTVALATGLPGAVDAPLATGLPGAVAAPTGGETRRRVLEGIGWGGVAVAGAVALWRFVTQPGAGPGLSWVLGMGESPGSRGTPRGPDGRPEEATPTADFYRVSKNLRDPSVDTAAWRLHVNGLVAKPIALTYKELQDLPQHEQWQTIICISNQVGGDYAGNALWRGVAVADLLRLAGGVPTRATRIVLRAADGYSESLVMASAMDPSTMVALGMNGEALPAAHGAPARLLVPGRYGLKSVKWLESIEVVDEVYRGYWPRRGWSDSAVIKTTSRIDIPRRGTVPAAQATRIAGMAYAGDRGISRVEISEDDGQTWRAARLTPPKGPLSWVFWEAPWTPPIGSQVKLSVRAVDGTGAVQSADVVPALPDGVSGYHKVTVLVSG